MRFTRLALVLLLPLGLVSCQGSWLGRSTARQAPATVRIGSWNLRWLGPSEHNRFEARRGLDLAAYIAAAGVDLLVLQEVGQSGPALRNDTLDATMAALNERGGDWTYQLFPSQLPQNAALLGMAWNRSVLTLAGNPAPLPIALNMLNTADDSLLLRCPPTMARFSAGDDAEPFVVVAVELAANVGPGDHVAHRVAEARLLMLAMQSAGLLSGRVVLIGEFGMPLNVETTSRLLETRSLRDLNPDNLATRATGEAYGRAYVPEDSAAMVTGALRVVDFPILTPEEFRLRLSDSYLFTVDVVARAPGK